MTASIPSGSNRTSKKKRGSHGTLLPPRALQDLAGGGGPATFTASDNESLGYLVDLCELQPSDAVLDVGCGAGRMALPLTRYLNPEGRYAGFDASREAIAWCTKNISRSHPNFDFTVVDIPNGSFNSTGRYISSVSSDLRFPYPDESFDVVLLTSLLTHLPAADVEHYMHEIVRVLKPGGRTLITFFLLNAESSALSEEGKASFNFEHEMQGRLTTHDGNPAAIAYPEAFVRDLYAECGLELREPLRYGTWCGRTNGMSGHDVVIAVKAPSINLLGQGRVPGSAEAEDPIGDDSQLELRPTYHGYLDRFSVLNRVVVFEGWASEADIEIYYDHLRLDVSLALVKRPDLVPIFGTGAEDWGFAACAALPTNEFDRKKIKLRLSQGIPDVNFEVFGPASDKVFMQMVDAFRAEVAQKPDPSLLEIGSRARSGNAYRGWFPEKLEYVGMDVHPGPNVDVVGDAHHLSRCVNRKFDFIFSMCVFEHILMPWKVALEMNKTLNDGGKALIISPPAWPLHEEPWDFFRFSKDSWHGIFNVHTGFRVVDAQYQNPASIVPIYGNTPDLDRMSEQPTFLLSGCVVEKTGPPQVAWEAEASAVYDLNYSHA